MLDKSFEKYFLKDIFYGKFLNRFVIAHLNNKL